MPFAPRSILCPIDFSEASQRALGLACDLAQVFSAEVHVIHVYQLSAYASPNSGLARDLESQVRRELEQFVGPAVQRGIPVRTGLRMGIPYVEIVEAAREIPADLIVMGTTGKTGLQHFLLGSVAERVVRSAEVPVLTVRYRSPEDG
ncbi:MAG: universal stress protein [Deltaproteobacteria bacterium]|nr:universal stress protein [Sandaracinaceae bacterium]MCX7808059.1 universal stress protein [Deltaproteobacteria bacterium]MDW8247030.1 universal stress protein [Sandaracinaceae bacterium]